MTMSPQQVDAMSMWQFFAMIEGMSGEREGLTSQEEDELWEFIRGD